MLALIRLQFGHGPLAVDHLKFHTGTVQALLASIRPRPAGRGSHGGSFGRRSLFQGFNSATARWPWITQRNDENPGGAHGASIRPRPAGRGSRTRPTSIASTVRGFNSATARWPWITSASSARCSPRRRPLQFGHGPLAVD